ncbi:MAG: crossover junction endodeoxyribonuclease RuvC [bacterium]|nr:crossover junction endodeoxyribonuclease RuvC [bacterium]
MRILGIDPGTATTGFSILESEKGKVKLLDYGCIRTKAGLKQNIRLDQIAKDITTLIKKWKPAKASIEKLFFSNNAKTAMTVAEARGVIIQKCTENGLGIEQYTPNEIKLAVCGYGKADKKMIQDMVKIILGLTQTPKPDDAADAIAAAICLANTIKP